MTPIAFDRRAEAELERAARWYQHERGVDLALRFIAEIDVELARIRERPDLFRIAHRTKSGFTARQANLRRFPYGIVFAVFPDRTQVVAIAHHRRRSKYWAYRLRK